MAVKQLDVVMAEGALDCTIGGLTATAHAVADPVHLTAFSCIMCVQSNDMPRHALAQRSNASAAAMAVLT